MSRLIPDHKMMLFFRETPNVEVQIDQRVFDANFSFEELVEKVNTWVELKVTTRKRVWQFPKERFVTYEPSDESWCRFFGIGKEIEVTETVTYPEACITQMQIPEIPDNAWPYIVATLFCKESVTTCHP